MAKPDPWRLVAENYPFSTVITTRFQDLDPMAHVNNVAMAGMFENGRVRFHHHIGRHPHDQGVRWLVAAVSINYVHEAHFPHDIVVYSGLGPIGNSSWTVMGAAFQDGKCVATCDTVMVAHGPDGRRRISDEVREAMVPHRVRMPAEVAG